LFAPLLWLASLLASSSAADAATPMVSLGEFHSLALQSDGTVLAWGSDAYGQLGFGRPLIGATAVKVPGLSRIRSIAGGQHHSLAVRLDGTVWAWGANGSGQLGDGTNIDRSSPVQVKGVSNIAMACGGGGHSAVLGQDGSVWTWGTNTSGQLGNGSPSGVWWSTAPGVVAGLTGAVSIACGLEQTFALLRDGGVMSWGANSRGELGDGSAINRAQPVSVSGLGNVTAINGMAALKQDGTVWEWGWTSGPVAPNLVPVRSAGISEVVALNVCYGSIWGARLEAIKSDGLSWWEWGPGIAPVAQTSVGRLTAAASSSSHTLLLKADGTVVAAGLNNSGQLGNAILPTGSWNWQSEFLPVVALANVVGLAAGEVHSLALDADGNVWSWGDDAHGQLGRGGLLATTIPSVVPGLSNIVQVAAGWGASLAVDASGNVWSWGNNYVGQLGDGTSTNRSAPLRVAGIQDVQAVAAPAAAYFPTTLALKRDGTVWAWGNNGDGQLGNGTTGGSSTLPVQVPGLANVAAVAAYWHMIAVKRDGTVWAWGSNDNGQLGMGTTTPSAVPLQVPGLSGVKAVVASGGTSFAVKTDGTAMGWGAASWDILGDGTWSDYNQLTPKPVPGLTNAVEISTGFSHVLARRSDGSVWAWGMGSASQMGGVPSGATPAVIQNLAPVQQISASGSGSALLGQDGLLYMGGGNSLGQLGDGTFAEHAGFVLAVSSSLNGYRNLSTGTTVNVAPALRVPFFVYSTGGITASSASVSTSMKFNAADIGKPGAVFVTAMAPMASLDAAQSAISRNPASSATIAASDGASFALMQLTATGWQLVVNGQLIPYASGVLGDLLAAQKILDGIDTSKLKGAEFCIGYGTSAAEMTSAGRMRSVATIPDPSAIAASSASCNVTWSGLAATDNVTGLWWNSAESGWGMNFNQQGGLLFGTLFTYDLSGKPLWLVMSNGVREANSSTFTGDLYQTTGPAFNISPFTPIGPPNITKTGTMSAAFLNKGTATLSYSVNGISVTKLIQPQVFGSKAAACQPAQSSRASLTNYQDLWWNAAESGWGVNVTHQDNTLFATLFTYDYAGRAMWLVMSAGVRQADGSYRGDLYQTTGPAFNAQPFTPLSAANVTRVGTMQFLFFDGVNGTLSYTVNGVVVSKAITRQEFSAPLPACLS
jgi:alpha-tubulin suppressor-like RCC1 family protein